MSIITTILTSTIERDTNLYANVLAVHPVPTRHDTVEVIFARGQAKAIGQQFPNAKIDATHAQGRNTRAILTGTEATTFLAEYQIYKTAQAAAPSPDEPTTGLFI